MTNTKKHELIKFYLLEIINVIVSEFIMINNSALRDVVQLNGCVQQPYLSVKSMIRRIKIIVIHEK
jgi:hypothetical protein